MPAVAYIYVLAAKMTTPKIIQVVKYFTMLTFVIGTTLTALTYFSPSTSLENGSALYGLLFVCSTLILLIIVVVKAVSQKSSRRRFIIVAAWLLVSLSIFYGCFLVWNYAVNTIIITITNNTGYEVTEAGIYGCFAQSWGHLPNGESKTVRFPANYDCAFAVTYKLNGNTKVELLPRQMGVKNKYALGNNSNISPDTKAANTSYVK